MVTVNTEKCIGCGACVRDCCMGLLMLSEGKAAPRAGRRCIECMHCAAVCPVRAIGFDSIPEEEIYVAPSEDPLTNLIRTRRSVRHFSDRLPERALVRECLNTANYAPSGKNQRAYHFTVVWGSEKVLALRDFCMDLCQRFGEAPELPKLLKKGTDLLTCGAPCMIILSGPDDCLNPVLDPAVAMTQLELLLVHNGLGTCWGGYLRQISDRFPEIRAWLRLPEGDRIRCALMVGYPKNTRYRNPVGHPAAPTEWIE